MEQFADEVDKVSDLEYLVRNKERQIEILRGELTEARHMCSQAENHIESVTLECSRLENKNMNLLQQL